MATPDAGWASYVAGDCSLAGQDPTTAATDTAGRAASRPACCVRPMPGDLANLTAARRGRGDSSGQAGSLLDGSGPPAVCSAPLAALEPASALLHILRAPGSSPAGLRYCQVPALPQLAGWFADSPIGRQPLYRRSARACANTPLTAVYIANAAAGLDLHSHLGRPASCLFRLHVEHELRPAIAYSQGQTEAQQAASVAAGSAWPRPTAPAR